MRTLASFVLLAALTSCGDDDDRACVPGETSACLGAGRCSGVQICDEFGSAFGACVCDEERDAGPRDASGETDAARDSETSTDAAVPTVLKAFPTAFGAGADVTGGRGGIVIPVTRLDDARDAEGQPVEGTLRYALTRREPRTLVFRVSGIITLGDLDGDGEIDPSESPWPSLLALESADFSNLTVAGQSAPEGGITIRGSIFTSGVSNMIWRYVRVRAAGTEATERFSAITFRDAHDVIVDHVSSAFGGQQALSITAFEGAPPQDAVTLQFSLLGQAKNGSIMGAVNGPGGTTTVHNNMYTHLSHRVPNLAGPQSYEVVNNLVYDWQFRLTNVHNALELNHLNNAYVAGPHTTPNLAQVGHKVHLGVDNTEAARVYTDGNEVSFADGTGWSTWRVFQADDTPAPAAMEASAAFPRHAHPVPLRSPERIRDALPVEVGAFRTLDENGAVVIYRDAVDERFLSEYEAGTSTVYGYNRAEFTFPAPPSSTPYPDSDRDGMPDAWERAHGLDPERADQNGDLDDDGYTNLEEFLNEVDAATVLG
ncbi:MAG: hypothetical protein AAGE52_24560 [Myxococcota bacterium]